MTDITQASGRYIRPQKRSDSGGRRGDKDVGGIRALLRRLWTFLFVAGVSGMLYVAWRVRGEQHLTAESGVGYALGIVGSVMMLLLLLYPLRKKIKFMRHLGSVRHWFRVHMMLGILGPALILIHGNFKLGSLNSNVALFAMLSVVGSGLVGRFLYSKIHHGLYGRQMTLEELRNDTDAIRQRAGLDIPEFPQVVERLRAFEADTLSRRAGILSSAYEVMTLGQRARRLRRGLRRELEPALRDFGRREGWNRRTLRSRRRSARKYISTYLASVRRVAAFRVYDRLFGLWHVLHLPLFILLVLAAIAHVVAVHLY